jgi:hypothetical protein
MAPILGIWASSRPSVTDTGAMFPLQVITVGPAGASSVEFTNIPGTYTHLQIRCIARTDRANALGDYLAVTVNSDTGSNYSSHALYGDGSSATVDTNTGATFATFHRFSGTSQTASVFGAGVLDILDYKDTNKYKTFRSLAGWDSNGSGTIFFDSNLWMSTSAITSIKLAVGGGTSINQYSQFALYGIKGAA